MRRAFVALVLGIGLLSGRAHAQATKEETDLVVVLDRSGSMRANDPRGLSKALALYLIDQLELSADGNRADLVSFATKVQEASPTLTADFDMLRASVMRLPRPDGLTDLEMALKAAYRILSPFDDGRRKQVVFLTDGVPMPNPADRDRFPELSAEFDKNPGSKDPESEAYGRLINQYAQRGVPQTLANIDKVVLPGFEGKIEVFPIGLGSQGTDRDFLRMVAVRTTGSEQAFTVVASSGELVLSAERISHKSDHSFLLLRDPHERGGTEYAKEFLVDPHLTKLRIVVAYLEEGVNSDDLELSLVLPDGSRVGRETQGSARYLAALDKDGQGALVFERFFLDNVATGTMRIEVSSKRATRALPRFEVLVEGRTNLKFLVEAHPNEIQVPGVVEVRGSLTDPGGQPVAISRAEGDLHDRDGRTRPIAFQVDAGGVAVAKVELAELPLGLFRVTARAYLRPQDPQGVTGRTTLVAKPAEPVQLSLSIPSGAPVPGANAGIRSLSRDKIVFPPIGDKDLGFTMRGLEVVNDSAKPASVALEMGPLSSKEGDLVDPGQWLRIQPTQGIASKERALPFDIVLQLPKRVPGSLHNGLYTGVFRVSSPDAAVPLEVPFEVTLAIPEVRVLDKVIAKNGALRFSFWWRRPNQLRRVVRIATDSTAAQKVTVQISPNVTGPDGETMDPQKLGVVNEHPETTEITIPPGETAEFSVLAIAGIRDLGPGNYAGEVFLDGERTRDVSIPVLIEVPRLAWIGRARWLATGVALLSALLAVWRIILLFRRQGVFSQQAWNLDRRTHFAPGYFRFGRRFQIHRQADGESYRLEAPGGSATLTTAGEPIALPADLEQGFEITSGPYRFRVLRIGPSLVQLRTLRSEFSLGMHRLAAAFTVIVAVTAAVLAIRWGL